MALLSGARARGGAENREQRVGGKVYRLGSWDATHTSHTEAENVEECSMNLGARCVTIVLGTWQERWFSR